MRNRKGFTLLEVVIVLVVAGLLVSIVVNSFGRTQTRMAPRAAQSQFLTMHAHARALAVERGVLARLHVDPGTGLVSVFLQDDPLLDQMEDWELAISRDFTASYGVTIETSPSGELQLAMTPRGYASPAANSFNDEGRVRFVRGNQAREVVLLPLGQAVQP